MHKYIVSIASLLLFLSCGSIPSPDDVDGSSTGQGGQILRYYSTAKILQSQSSMYFYSREFPGGWSYSYEYEYDDIGRLVLMTRTGEGTTVLFPTTYEGNIKTTVNGSQKIVEEYADEDMKVLISWTSYTLSASGEKLDSKIVYDKRDDKGRALKSTHYAMRNVDGEWTLSKVSGSEIVYQDSGYKTVSTESCFWYSADGSTEPSNTIITTSIFKNTEKTLPLEVTEQRMEWGEPVSRKTEYSYNEDNLVTMVKDYLSDELIEVRRHSYSGNRHCMNRTTRYNGSKYVYQEELREEILYGNIDYEYYQDFVSPIPMRPEDDYSEAECSCSLAGLDVELSQCWQENGYVLLYIKITNNLSYRISSLAIPWVYGGSQSVATDNNGNCYTIHPRVGVGSLAIGETRKAAFQVDVSAASYEISMMDFVIEACVNPDSDALPATITLKNVRVHLQ